MFKLGGIFLLEAKEILLNSCLEHGHKSSYWVLNMYVLLLIYNINILSHYVTELGPILCLIKYELFFHFKTLFDDNILFITHNPYIG